MKQLPVFQNSPFEHSPAPQPSEPLHTAGLERDVARESELKPLVVQALSKVFDPEIPVNIYDLGLIYDIIVTAAGVVGIRMTLTAPACPAAQFLPIDVQKRAAEVPGVSDVKVDVVWDPPWDRERMSDAARLQLGMF